MKCNICNNPKMLRMHQIGVIYCQRTAKGPEPEILFDTLLCPACGNIQADPDTISAKVEKNQWTDITFKELIQND